MKSSDRTSPKFTVIIPTRERADVLRLCLRTVTSQNYDNLEILVSDNHSADNTEQVVREANDPRIRYVNTGKRLSMSHNWEFAISHVSDGWITVLGDDDGLLPDSLRKVAVLISTSDVQAIRSAVCNYIWPAASRNHVGELHLPLRRGVEVRQSARWLADVIHGRRHYFNLPMLYNGGYVETSAINKLRERGMPLYRSCIPDVYSAFAIASVIDRYLYSYEPLAMSGTSHHSYGTACLTPKDDASDSARMKFLSEENIALHSFIPRCDDGKNPASVQALVYESYLQTEFLRPQSSDVTPAQQLSLILAEGGQESASVYAWAQKFAAQHGLAMPPMRSEDAAKAARTFEFRHRWRDPQYYIYGSDRCPIRDVCEASATAARLLDHGLNQHALTARHYLSDCRSYVRQLWRYYLTRGRTNIGVSQTATS